MCVNILLIIKLFMVYVAKPIKSLNPNTYIKLSERHNLLLRIRVDVPKQMSE